MKWPYIDFMGKRRILFVISAVLVALSIGVIAFRGLSLGIEFRGGTVLTMSKVTGATIADVRAKAEAVGIDSPIVQTSTNGFIVRWAETDTTVSNQRKDALTEALNVPSADTEVRVIGPEWGGNITNAAMLALAVSIMAILAYVSIRFEYKMAITGVVALAHDVIITLGLYALVGREVNPNTIAALLTIMGYSLYDTIVVFHRIRENTVNLSKKSFMSMANDSLNQVLARWVNTGMSSLIPVVCLLILGGSTLKDFAFALTVGLVAGAYSSMALASPLFTVWKEREPRYRALAKKYAGASK